MPNQPSSEKVQLPPGTNPLVVTLLCICSLALLITLGASISKTRSTNPEIQDTPAFFQTLKLPK